jgi:hypothetical protein
MEECDIRRQLAAKSLNQRSKGALVPPELQRLSVESGACGISFETRAAAKFMQAAYACQRARSSG